MKKVVRYLGRSFGILITLIAGTWYLGVYAASGDYLREGIFVRLGGKSVTSTVDTVRKNLSFNAPNNFLAHIAYTTEHGEIFSRDFRVAYATFDPSAKVTIQYKEATPLRAVLKEDGGYFAESLSGIGWVTVALIFTWVGLLALDRSLR